MQEICHRPACPGLVPPPHHPSSPGLPAWARKLLRTRPLLCASLQSFPILQRALEPTRDLPSITGIQHALSSLILFLNPALEGRQESSLLCWWCLKKKGCSHCASCSNQPNHPFQWHLMSLKLSWPEPPSLSAGETASARTVLS